MYVMRLLNRLLITTTLFAAALDTAVAEEIRIGGGGGRDEYDLSAGQAGF